MFCILQSLKIKSKSLYFFVDFLLVFSCIHAKVIDKNGCPLIDIECEGQSSHRPQGYQRNSALTVTPKIQVPLDLTESVGTGFTIALPIKVKFQSQVDLMSDWVKQFLATKTNRLTKNFNSFSASLTQLLGILSPTNAGPNSGEQHNRPSAPGTWPDTSTGDSTVHIDSDPNTSAAHTSESNLSAGNSKRKDSHKPVLQTQFAKDRRAQSRNMLFKSIEISHSTLGKSCLLRAICEVSQTPLSAPNTGIIGELIDMFLSVDSLHESFPDFEDYFNAQTVGRNSFVKQSGHLPQNYSFVDECRLYYGNDCPFSLFNIYNVIPINA